MKKKVLVSLLAMGLLLGCLPAKAEAEAACDHHFQTQVSDNVTGAYTHTYIAPGGETKACSVTSGTRTYRVICIRCGQIEKTWSVTYTNQHSTNHD